MSYSKNSFTRFSFVLGSGLLATLAATSCKVSSGPTEGTSPTSLADTAPATVANGGGTTTSGGGNTTTTPVTTTTTTTTTPVTTTPVTTTPVAVAAAQVGIGTVSPQTMNLGVSTSVPVTLMSQNGFAGTLALSVNTALLTAQDPNKTFTVSVSPASVTLTAGGTATANVSITSTTESPDLSSTITLVATPTTGSATTAQIPLTVNAVYEVDIMSVGTTKEEVWSLAFGSKTSFATHTGGITINFVNKDTTQASGFYRVHSSATAFLHQGTEGLGLPGTATPSINDGKAAASTDSAVTLGPVYTVVVTSQTAKLSDTYYDHNHETATGRSLIFNAFAVPTPIAKSGNPNASYAFLQTNLFGSAQCVSCHSASAAPTMGNGVNLSTYAGVLTQLTAGSAVGSPLYVNIATGTATMPQGNPGSVSATLQTDLENWINDGAANN
jgi:hypothetical protein